MGLEVGVGLAQRIQQQPIEVCHHVLQAFAGDPPPVHVDCADVGHERHPPAYHRERDAAP